jgi:hypothetical protein
LAWPAFIDEPTYAPPDGGAHPLRTMTMLMKTPAAVLEAQASEDRMPERPEPAATWREAVGFVIAFILCALLVYVSVKYGIATTEVMK